MTSYQPRSSWDSRTPSAGRRLEAKPQPDVDPNKAPRQGEAVTIGGRDGRVVLFEPGMNMVEVDWDDKGGATSPVGCNSFFVIADWKKMWGEK